jgi:hypothetical protein
MRLKIGFSLFSKRVICLGNTYFVYSHIAISTSLRCMLVDITETYSEV